MELYAGQPMAYEVIAWLSQSEFVLDGIYNTYYDKNGSAI